MTNTSAGVDIDYQALWAKYEDITMHFNDLLMKLRSQSLAGIAAVSTLVGLFTKEGAQSLQLGWMAATGIFCAMGVFWIAIFFLDFFYYNRLLNGAADAVIALEIKITDNTANGIGISKSIAHEFSKLPSFRSYFGVLLFYFIVFVVIVLGAVVSGRMYLDLTPFWGVARPA